MKRMDYTISGHGRQRTITPLSNRAKERTPAPVEFGELTEAKLFLKTTQAEGFRFAGANLIDPEQKQVKNRYYVIGDDGQLTAVGDDWGPLDTVWEEGDVMPGQSRNTGTEAVIEKIVKGDSARKMMGCDLAFLLRLRSIAGLN
jgi:hypothetical protein